MLLNKYVVPALVTAVIFAAAATGCPVYAQDNSDSGGGFFGGIGKFFSRMWGGETENTNRPQPAMQKREDRGTEGSTQPGMTNQKMMPGKEASAEARLLPGEEGRLTALVAQGKITEAQKTAILAKMKSIQEELKTWATAQGIDPQYVMMPGAPKPVNIIREGSPSGMQKPGMKPAQPKREPESGMNGKEGMAPQNGENNMMRGPR